MHSTSTSLKVAVGALAVASAVFGLTGCGKRAVERQVLGSSMMPGISSVQFDVGQTAK